jgi:hypothetical protein
MSKIIQSRNCWIWIGAKIWSGYGQFGLNGKLKLAHRVSYELFKEDIPEGLQLDHLCKNRSCVNPDHLEIVTTQENTRRGLTGKINHHKLKNTHCPQGHPYSEENTYLYNNGRKCRECSKVRMREYHDRNKLKKIMGEELK